MRYQSTPEKEFDGDIIITDPCYIIRNENGITKNDWHYCEYGEYMERLGIKNYLTHDTIYGDWGCTVFDSDTKKPVQMPVLYPYFCWMKFLPITQTSIITQRDRGRLR